MMPACLRRPAVRLVLVCLVGSSVWLSCDGCEVSSSFTDHERRLREMDEIDERNWREAERRRWEREEKWHTQSPVQRRFKKRFEGKIVPGVGCEVCPDECKVWDLRPMDPEAFKQHFRATVRQWVARQDDDVARHLLALKLIRLGCMAAADAPRLVPALQALSSPDEDYDVRLEALDILWTNELVLNAEAAYFELFYRGDDKPRDASPSDAR